MVQALVKHSEHSQSMDGSRECGDPSHEEIRIRAAAIRAQWSASQRRRRRVSAEVEWLPPQIHLNDWMASIASEQLV